VLVLQATNTGAKKPGYEASTGVLVQWSVKGKTSNHKFVEHVSNIQLAQIHYRWKCFRYTRTTNWKGGLARS